MKSAHSFTKLSFLALCFSLGTAGVSHAEDKAYTECVTVLAPKYVKLRDLEPGGKLNQKSVMKVPKGWTPISAGQGGYGTVLFCK